MYAGELSSRDRAGPIAAVILVHAALAFMLAALAGQLPPRGPESALKLFDVREVPPPRAIPVPPPVKAREASARPRSATPANRASEASPIVAPVPAIVLPARSPVVVAAVPSTGSAPTQGAAPVAGPGTGASGTGLGMGGGGSGAGNGDEGDGTRPRPLFRQPNPRSFRRELVEDLPRGARVFILFTVQLDGQVTDCSVRESSGNPALDATLCQIAEQHFRYDPARHGDGTPYVARAGYMQVF